MILVAGSLLAADADKDSIKSAAKKLADSGYSWKQTTENAGGNGGGGGRGGGGGNFEGKAGKDGTFFVSLPGRNNSTTEGIVKGDKYVVKNADGEWQTAEEITAAAANNANAGGGGRRGRGGPGAMLRNFKGPAVLVGDMADDVKEFKTSEGVTVGDFTEDGAKKHVMGGRGGRGGNNPPEISNAKGTVKYWVKDGAISKVEYHVTGTISINGNDRDVDRTTTIEFKDVGSTNVTVPEAAAKKLS